MPRTSKQVLADQEQQAERDRTPASRATAGNPPGRPAGDPGPSQPAATSISTRSRPAASSAGWSSLTARRASSSLSIPRRPSATPRTSSCSPTRPWPPTSSFSPSRRRPASAACSTRRTSRCRRARSSATTTPRSGRSGLSGRPEDPWREELMVVLKRPATMELLTFSTMSKTGRRAVGNLLKHYDRLQVTSPGSFPVVRLKPAGYQDSRYGWVHTPNFVVVGVSPGTYRGYPRYLAQSRNERRDTVLDRPLIPFIRAAMAMAKHGTTRTRLAPPGWPPPACSSSRSRPARARRCFSGWRKRSSNDAATVAQWWQQYPNALPALDLAKCGLVVLDGDRHDASVDGVAALRELVRRQAGFDPRRVPMVRTPRDGVHLYFQAGQPAVRQPPRRPAGRRRRARRRRLRAGARRRAPRRPQLPRHPGAARPGRRVRGRQTYRRCRPVLPS